MTYSTMLLAANTRHHSNTYPMPVSRRGSNDSDSSVSSNEDLYRPSPANNKRYFDFRREQLEGRKAFALKIRELMNIETPRIEDDR